jgi:hypothetical protein
MQRIILRLGGKNKKEEISCHENVKKVPFYRRYTNVCYVDLRERVDTIFKIRSTTTTTKFVAQRPPLLLLFRRRWKKKVQIFVISTHNFQTLIILAHNC